MSMGTNIKQILFTQNIIDQSVHYQYLIAN